MVTYKEAGKMLDAAMEALPRGIFDGLNGGVNLIEEAMPDSRGGYILGLYHNNMMGRYIELFYGSFVGLYGDIPPMQFERRLKSTLHHELTHHIEGLAGDRSLEHWDEDQEFIWDELGDEPLFVGSILFVDDDDSALAPAAKAFFEMYSKERCPDIPCESAGLFSAGKALQPDCRMAAEALGADFGGHECKELTDALFDAFEVVMCMSLAQVDELLERYPGSERKVICADETDILRPRLKMGWKKAVERVRAVIDDETEQLRLPSVENVSIEPIGPEAPEAYLDSILSIEESCFPDPWTREMLESYLRKDSTYFFSAVSGGELLGYIGSQLVLDELEIFNVAVDESCRRQHLGEKLVERLISEARRLGALRVTLEVRASNAPAIALYEKLGFSEVGRRKNYYRKPREDAVLMDRPLGEAQP